MFGTNIPSPMTPEEWNRMWRKQHPPSEPPLPEGITYGGRGPGGEYYSKDGDIDSHSLWTEGDESWTADELEAIARHKRFLDGTTHEGRK